MGCVRVWNCIKDLSQMSLKKKYVLNLTDGICMYELVFKSIKKRSRNYFCTEGVVPCTGSCMIRNTLEVIYMWFISVLHSVLCWSVSLMIYFGTPVSVFGGRVKFFLDDIGLWLISWIIICRCCHHRCVRRFCFVVHSWRLGVGQCLYQQLCHGLMWFCCPPVDDDISLEVLGGLGLLWPRLGVFSHLARGRTEVATVYAAEGVLCCVCKQSTMVQIILSYRCSSIVNNICYFSEPEMLKDLLRNKHIKVNMTCKISFFAGLLAGSSCDDLITKDYREILMQKFLDDYLKSSPSFSDDNEQSKNQPIACEDNY